MKGSDRQLYAALALTGTLAVVCAGMTAVLWPAVFMGLCVFNAGMFGAIYLELRRR